MKIKEFVIVVFSHADSKQKEDFLVKSLLSLKQLELPIILASHLAVPIEAQNLSDYFIKDSDNLIVDEGDIFNASDLSGKSKDLYYVHDSCGGLRFSTNTFKKTYQAGVFNLYINSIGLAKKIGFENIILWEFDFALGPQSANSLKNILEQYRRENSKFFFFGSFIQDLPCMNAIPTVFNTDLAYSIFPKKPIQDAKSFAGISNLMIMEQWMLSNFKKTGSKFLEFDLNDFDSVFSDLVSGQIHSQKGSYMFFNLRSGLYFSENCDEVLFYTLNCSDSELRSELEIIDGEGNNIYQKEHHTKGSWWAFDKIPENIFKLFFSDAGILVREHVYEIESGKESTFSYYINSNNVYEISKLKKFKILENT